MPCRYGLALVHAVSSAGFTSAAEYSAATIMEGTTGDYFLSHSPIAGWALSYQASGASTTSRYINNGLLGYFDLAPSSVSAFTVGKTRMYLWTGVTRENVVVKRLIYFDDTDRALRTAFAIRNDGNTTVSSVRFLENFAPSHGLSCVLLAFFQAVCSCLVVLV